MCVWFGGDSVDAWRIGVNEKEKDLLLYLHFWRCGSESLAYISSVQDGDLLFSSFDDIDLPNSSSLSIVSFITFDNLKRGYIFMDIHFGITATFHHYHAVRSTYVTYKISLKTNDIQNIL